MNKYQDGKIYKLTSKQTDKIYVGSTIRTLVARMSHHRCYMKDGNSHNIASTEILKYDDCIIELIEDYPCDSKTELEKREQHYMDLYKDIIVNKQNTTTICEHNKQRHYCIECKGNGICEHNKQRRNCKECKGSQICDHLKRKHLCNICNNFKMCNSICRDKTPCPFRAKPDSDYCGNHTPK